MMCEREFELRIPENNRPLHVLVEEALDILNPYSSTLALPQEVTPFDPYHPNLEAGRLMLHLTQISERKTTDTTEIKDIYGKDTALTNIQLLVDNRENAQRRVYILFRGGDSMVYVTDVIEYLQNLLHEAL